MYEFIGMLFDQKAYECSRCGSVVREEMQATHTGTGCGPQIAAPMPPLPAAVLARIQPRVPPIVPTQRPSFGGVL